MWHDFEEVQIANENKTTRMMFLNIFLIWTQWARYSRSGCGIQISGSPENKQRKNDRKVI